MATAEQQVLMAGWLARTAQAGSPAELPTRHRPDGAADRSATCRRRIPPPVAAELDAFVRQWSISHFATALAVCQVLLSRYSGRDAFLMGLRCRTATPAGAIRTLIGVQTNGERSFLAIAAQAAADLDFVHRHGEAFAELPSRGGMPATVITVAEVPPSAAEDDADGVDILIHWEADTAEIRCRYPQARHAAADIERFLGHFCHLFKRLLGEPSAPIARHPVLTRQAQSKVLREWNDTTRPYPAAHTIHALFERQAAARPDAEALFLAGRTMCYGTLNRQANRLAHHLRRHGVRPGAIVGVCLPRSFELVTALLAVLKCGAGYLPLDAALPEERLSMMLADSAVATVVSAGPGPAGRRHTAAEWIDLAELADAIGADCDTNLPPGSGAGDIAYVNYTSGSTGRPKGVAIPHRGVIRLVSGCSYARLDGRCRVLQLATPSFDALSFELWGPLLNGGCCVLYDGAFPTLPKLRETVQAGRVDTVFLTTALFNTIIDEAPDLLAPVKQLLTGGEAHSAEHMRRALSLLPTTRIASVYGPTENTTFTTVYPVRDVPAAAASIPIGRPIDNTQAFVLDQHRHLAPVGVVGELYVGGAGLAAGYLGAPELTAERFVNRLPFLPPDQILYRTGDLVRRLPDGNLDFVGRTDGQIKLHGYRIEIGEIEARLMAQPEVRQAAVLVHGTSHDNRRLVAFVAGRPGAEGNAGLRRRLSASLPRYMMPADIHWVECLPLTPNGKLDRMALAALATVQAAPADQP